MRQAHKKVDAEDREADGVRGVLSDAAKNLVDPNKQKRGHGLLR